MVADICGVDIEKATADLKRMLEKQAKNDQRFIRTMADQPGDNPD